MLITILMLCPYANCAKNTWEYLGLLRTKHRSDHIWIITAMLRVYYHQRSIHKPTITPLTAICLFLTNHIVKQYFRLKVQNSSKTLNKVNLAVWTKQKEQNLPLEGDFLFTLFSHSLTQQLWVAVLEKCCVKIASS